MKKITTIFIGILLTMSLYGQENFVRYVYHFSGGLTIGGVYKGATNVEIDSLINDAGVLKFYSGGVLVPVSGSGSMVYPGAGIPLSTGSAWGTSITNSSANWNTAYDDRLKWDGGATGLTAATGRTSLGGTTAGQALFTLTNPSAITFLRVNADNTASALSAADFRTAIDAAASSHTQAQSTITVLADSLLARYTKTQANTRLNLKINKSDSVNYASGYMSRYDGVTGLALKQNILPDSVAYTANSTLALTDANKLIVATKATSILLTIPANADVAIPIGTTINFVQAGAGIIVFKEAAGVTIYSKKDSIATGGIYSWAALYKRATNKWLLYGDILD